MIFHVKQVIVAIILTLVVFGIPHSPLNQSSVGSKRSEPVENIPELNKTQATADKQTIDAVIASYSAFKPQSEKVIEIPIISSDDQIDSGAVFSGEYQYVLLGTFVGKDARAVFVQINRSNKQRDIISKKVGDKLGKFSIVELTRLAVTFADDDNQYQLKLFDWRNKNEGNPNEQ